MDDPQKKKLGIISFDTEPMIPVLINALEEMDRRLCRQAKKIDQLEYEKNVMVEWIENEIARLEGRQPYVAECGCIGFKEAPCQDHA